MFPDETRWTPAYLLEDELRPSNTDILVNCPVDKVVFDAKKRATGVMTADGEFISASKEVLLTTGSLGT